MWGESIPGKYSGGANGLRQEPVLPWRRMVGVELKLVARGQMRLCAVGYYKFSGVYPRPIQWRVLSSEVTRSELPLMRVLLETT